MSWSSAKGNTEVLHQGRNYSIYHTGLGLTGWRAASERRTWRSWWTVWSWASSWCGDREARQHSGLHKKEHCQQVEAAGPCSVLSPGETHQECYVQNGVPQYRRDMGILEQVQQRATNLLRDWSRWHRRRCWDIWDCLALILRWEGTGKTLLILYMCVRGHKQMESDSSQWCLMIGQEANFHFTTLLIFLRRKKNQNLEICQFCSVQCWGEITNASFLESKEIKGFLTTKLNINFTFSITELKY